MALPIGKLTILVGAGILGSVLAKEGRLSDVSGLFSGALKIAWKQIKKEEASPSRPKPHNDSLIEEVNILRQQIQNIALKSSESLKVVTSTSSGRRGYGLIIIVVVAGYGFIWWKGWEIPMFATRRSLSDACNKVAKQLENVYTSISATKRHLSSRIDRVDCNLDECAEVTATTHKEVSELRGEVEVIGVDFKIVHNAVRTLETKINRIEGKQAQTASGVCRLLNVASTLDKSLEDSRATECIQAGSSSSAAAALELPQMTPPSRAGSLPPTLSLEPPSSSNGNHKVKRPLHGTVSASGLKDLRGISDVLETPSSPVEANHVETNGNHVAEDAKNGSSSSGLFLLKLPSFGASFLTRTRSVVPSFK